MNEIKVATSGYFNPIHSGHLQLLREAKKLGTYLVVIVNNDEQVKVKGSKPFMSVGERVEILKAIRYVDEVVVSIDSGKDVSKTLAFVQPDIFAKGGDSKDVPEQRICDEMGTKVVYGVGTNIKINSSSSLKWHTQ